MSTTTIRIDDGLKSRVAAVAEKAGQSAHSFIVEAITRTVEQAEWSDALDRVADARWATLTTAGKSVPWDGAKAWLEARSRGERPSRPPSRKLER